MKRFTQQLSDIKDIKNIHWRHILQSILVFSCFCTLDTIAESNNIIWLISAASVVIAIGLIMILGGKIKLYKHSNILNIIAIGLLIGCNFTQVLYPITLFFITLIAGIRLIYTRQKLNDYCLLIFVIVSVFAGIIIRFLFILLPIWCLGLFMLLTLFNPIMKKDVKEVITEKNNKNDKLIIIAIISLVLFFLCIEVFGGPLTAEVSNGFLMGMVNITYLLGYLIFILLILILRIKIISIITMMLAVLALFFFLIPPMTTFGIYFLLFLGGGIKVLMLAFPISLFKYKYRWLGAVGGIFLYRLAFLVSGTVETIAKNQWYVTSNLTYTLAAINIFLAIGLIFILTQWDRYEIKIAIEEQIKGQLIINKTLPDNLSPREKEVALLILEGNSVEEIASRLFIADSTVRVHVKSILFKTNCNSQKLFIIKHGTLYQK